MKKQPNIVWRAHRNAWFVSISKAGRKNVKSFSARRYGTKTKALSAAMAWRDECRRQVGSRIVQNYHCRNTTGVIGVSREVRINRSGEELVYWVSRWHEGHRPKTRRFAALKYGEEQACELAVRARREAVEEPGKSSLPNVVKGLKEAEYLRALETGERKPRYIHWEGNAWRVRIGYGDRDSKRFLIAQYGSKSQALDAAVAWRDTLLRKLDPPAPARPAPQKPGPSGVVGVQLAVRGKGRYWMAAWRDNGLNRTRAFSITKYGDRKAFRLAVQARKAGVRKSTVERTREARSIPGVRSRM